MLYVCKWTTLMKQIELMSIIDISTSDTPYSKYLWMKKNIFSVIHYFYLDQIPKIKICHKVASEHPEVIEWG